MKKNPQNLIPPLKSGMKKLLLTMKLAFGILLISILQVSANVYSQVHVNIDVRDKTVRDVLKSIEEQTDIRFFYSDDLLVLNKKVDVKVDNKDVITVLDNIFTDSPLTYKTYQNNLIVIVPKDLLQQQIISGTVSDKQSGEPMAGVNVVVKGTTIGSITDTNGRYTISVPDKDAILIFSFVGYGTIEVPGGGKDVVNVNLTSDILNLDEVVVIGYGTQRKVNLTGATAVVKQEEIQNRSVAKVSEILQGSVAGLAISNTTGGDPDAKLSWQIRGQGSPYILVDGIPIDINNLNPSDIESVTVLKDAASAAIYGARAAYGVVLITTKSGMKGAERTEITYSNNLAWATPTTLPEPMNSLEYATWYNEAAKNAGAGQIFSDEVINHIKAYMADPKNAPSTYPDPNDPNKWGRMMYANANTNWYDVFFSDWKLTQQQNISVNGGTDKSGYYVSAGYYDNSGQMNYGDDKFKRYTTSANLNFDINKWLSVRFQPKYTRTISDWPHDGYGGNGLGRAVLFHDIARRWPTDPVKTPDGQWGEMSRIHIYESGARDKYQDEVLYLTFETEIEPVKDWKITGSYTYNHRGYNRSVHQPVVYMNGINGVPYITFDLVPPSQIYKIFNYDSYQKLDIYSNYSFRLGDHSFNIMAGHNRETGTTNSLNATKQNLITNAVPSLSTAIGRMTNGDGISSWATMGFFGRINYNYKEKYLLEVNGRYDGSYKYRKEDRWGFFPSVSLAYRISEENFYSSLKPYVPYLKFRASYGSLGDQNGLPYSFLSIMNINSEISWVSGSERPPTVFMPSILSESLTWETLTTLNFGLDAEFLRNRLGTTFDWFVKDRTGIVTTGTPLPSLLGASTPVVNGDALETKGWELSLTWNDKIKSDFRYSVGFNLSNNITKVTETQNPDGLLSRNYVGKEVGEIWGFISEGLFQTTEEIAGAPSQKKIYGAWYPGDVRYKDLNNDKEISVGKNTLDDPGDQTIIGNSLPRYFYNIKAEAGYKNFDFSMFWSGIGEYDVWFNSGQYMFWGYGGNMWQLSGFKPHLDYWRSDNPDAYYPRQAYDIAKNRQVSSRYLQNGAFLRLKNVQLGYTIPVSILNKISIEKARIYISAENIVTFKSLQKAFDPEALTGQYGSGKIFPLSKTISFGINVTL